MSFAVTVMLYVPATGDVHTAAPLVLIDIPEGAPDMVNVNAFGELAPALNDKAIPTVPVTEVLLTTGAGCAVITTV